MEITIYGKRGCSLCRKAKEKLERLNLPYVFKDLDAPDIDWRQNGYRCAMAEYCIYDTLPIICVDGGYFEYAPAMKRVKQVLKKGGPSVG